MNQLKAETQADYISLDLTNRVLNQTLNINEAMYSLVLATSYLLARTLPRPAFSNELDNSRALAQGIVGVINAEISKNPNLTPARIMLSLNLVMDILMDSMNRE